MAHFSLSQSEFLSLGLKELWFVLVIFSLVNAQNTIYSYTFWWCYGFSIHNWFFKITKIFIDRNLLFPQLPEKWIYYKYFQWLKACTYTWATNFPVGLPHKSNVTARPRPEFEATICIWDLHGLFFFFDKKVFSNHITNTFCNTLSLSAEDFKYFYSLFTTRNEISKRKLFKIRFGDKVLQQPSHQTGLKEVTSACRGSADPPCKKVPH